MHTISTEYVDTDSMVEWKDFILFYFIFLYFFFFYQLIKQWIVVIEKNKNNNLDMIILLVLPKWKPKTARVPRCTGSLSDLFLAARPESPDLSLLPSIGSTWLKPWFGPLRSMLQYGSLILIQNSSNSRYILYIVYTCPSLTVSAKPTGYPPCILSNLRPPLFSRTLHRNRRY